MQVMTMVGYDLHFCTAKESGIRDSRGGFTYFA